MVYFEKWRSGMHTDEFEISLFRELKVCTNTIHRIRKSLSLMEEKHKKSTEFFLEEYRSGKLAADTTNSDDYAAWWSSCESLKQWLDLERQYQEQFRAMRISVKTAAKQTGGRS